MVAGLVGGGQDVPSDAGAAVQGAEVLVEVISVVVSAADQGEGNVIREGGVQVCSWENPMNGS